MLSGAPPCGQTGIGRRRLNGCFGGSSACPRALLPVILKRARPSAALAFSIASTSAIADLRRRRPGTDSLAKRFHIERPRGEPSEAVMLLMCLPFVIYSASMQMFIDGLRTPDDSGQTTEDGS
jgi:hypothetical protein